MEGSSEIQTPTEATDQGKLVKMSFGFTVSILFALSACTSPGKREGTSIKSGELTASKLFVEPKSSKDIPEGLQHSEIEEDLQILSYALENAYIGKRFIEKSLFDKTLSELWQIPNSGSYPMPLREFAERIDEALLNLPDSHIQSQSKYGISMARLRVMEERGPGVGENIAAKSEKPWRMTSVKTKSGRVPVLGISRLPTSEDRGWQGFKSSVPSWLNGHYAILDLRRNSGGDDTLPIWLSDRVAGKGTSPYKFRFTRKTPEANAILINMARNQIASYKGEGPKSLTNWLKWLTQEYENSLASSSDQLERTDFASSKETSEKPYEGQIFVLTDRYCVSSCETAVKAFKKSQRVRTVGTSTGGFFHFGNLGYIELPHSRILIEMGTSYFELDDGSFIEKVGIKPDIEVPTGQDALAYTAKNLID